MVTLKEKINIRRKCTVSRVLNAKKAKYYKMETDKKQCNNV